MFRELSQKKNIITLTLIVWLLFEYFSLPVCALYGGRTTDEQINTEVISNSLDNIVDSDFDNGVAAIEVDNTENIQLEQTEISNADISIDHTNSTLCAPNNQTTVESEVIDEYFDDAHDTGNYKVPSVNTNFKSYTYYALLNKGSIQWKLQEIAYTDENGLRKIENYYLAAMGSYYSTTIGDIFRLTTDTGKVFDVIICDVKADRHTDSQNMYTISNNCMVEFYVDTTVLNRDIKRMGSVGVLPQFNGSIAQVESLGHYEW